MRGERRGVAEEGVDAEGPLGVIAPQSAAGHEFPVVAIAMRDGPGVFEATILFKGADIGHVEQCVEDFVVGISYQHYRHDCGCFVVVGDFALGLGLVRRQDHQ